MPRPTIQVDQKALTEAIRQAESKGPLANQTLVFQAACDIYNKKVKPAQPLKPSTACNRAAEWGIKLVTPKGKPGGQMTKERVEKMVAGAKASRATRVDRGTRMSLPVYQESLGAMRRMNPETPGLVDEIGKGSLRAAVDLNCRHCMGHDDAVSAIRRCPSKGCAFWPFRPYKTAAEEAAIAQLEGTKGGEVIEGVAETGHTLRRVG